MCVFIKKEDIKIGFSVFLIWFLFFYFFPTDIDECDKSLGPNGKCGANALCSNTPGGFTCACQAGYTGDPYVNCYGESKSCLVVGFCYCVEILF